MIYQNLIRQSLKSIAPVTLLLFCCSIGAFAQSPSIKQESAQSSKSVSINDSLKTVISSLGNQLSLNIVFDDSVKDERVTLELKEVTAKQVMKIILIQKRLQARIIEENTIIIFPDNDANRARYNQYDAWPAKSDATK